jgi:hypothetical protein
LIVEVPVFVIFSVACRPPDQEFSTVHVTAAPDGTDVVVTGRDVVVVVVVTGRDVVVVDVVVDVVDVVAGVAPSSALTTAGYQASAIFWKPPVFGCVPSTLSATAS